MVGILTDVVARNGPSYIDCYSQMRAMKKLMFDALDNSNSMSFELCHGPWRSAQFVRVTL
jgi:hypothetical protein